MTRGLGVPFIGRIFGAGIFGLLITVATDAHADLDLRASRLVWEKGTLLRGSFSFREAIDDKAILKKLSNGMAVTLVMRGYVYPNTGGDPVALTAHSCRIAYDLWNEIFKVVVNGQSRIAVNLKGVFRLCTDLVDVPIVERSILRNPPSTYFLGVKVEVNPVSDDMAKKIHGWVTRPSGTSGAISPGDALFASFVGVFMKRVMTADRVIEFRTAAFPDK